MSAVPWSGHAAASARRAHCIEKRNRGSVRDSPANPTSIISVPDQRQATRAPLAHDLLGTVRPTAR